MWRHVQRALCHIRRGAKGSTIQALAQINRFAIGRPYLQQISTFGTIRAGFSFFRTKLHFATGRQGDQAFYCLYVTIQADVLLLS
jgi:hypothetical protein